MKTASQAKMKTASLKRYIQDEDRILGKKEMKTASQEKMKTASQAKMKTEKMKTASFKVTSQMKTAFEEIKR